MKWSFSFPSPFLVLMLDRPLLPWHLKFGTKCAITRPVQEIYPRFLRNSSSTSSSGLSNVTLLGGDMHCHERLLVY